MHGPPGSGKTCSQCLLRNEKPPAEAVTDSTPIACRAVKATKASIHDDGCLKEVDSYDVLVALESDLNAHQQRTPSIIKHSADHVSSVADHDENPVKMSSADPASDSDVEKVCANIIQAIQKGKAKSLQEHRWVYIIDSGGQPACQELLPLFTRAASLNIITIDLSKGINKKIEYQYRIGGKSFNCDPNVTCTNIDFLRTVLSSGAILQPYNTAAVSSDTTKCPIYLVLGTHKDIATQEDIDNLNNELSSLVLSASEKKGYRLFPATIGGSKDIIYPINTLEKGPARQESAKEFCDTILNTCAAATFQIRIQWFVFELVLQKKAEKKNCNILEMDDVLSAGRSLQMSEDNTKKALQFFHDVTIILYYPDVLPNIVFVNPLPILETLTQLLALTYQIKSSFLHHITNETPSPEELNSIAKNGIFTESLLSKLKSDDQKFSKSDFIKLLLHLRIIAKTEDDKEDKSYFIPCALKSYTQFDPPKAHLKPLLIVWCNPINAYTDEILQLPVPHGIFPSTIIRLLNNEEPQFRIPPSFNGYFKFRDAMSLRIHLCGNYIGTIHIINKYKHIEVYYTGCEPAKYCPSLCELITEAVTHSSDALGVRQCHEHAFICPLENEEKCYCIVTKKDERKVKCTSCPKPAIIKGQEYWTWFHNYTPQSSSEGKKFHFSFYILIYLESDPPQCLDVTWLDEVKKSLEEKQFIKSKWKELGLKLGLYINTLDTIDYNNPRDADGCLRGMLSKWLQGADKVLDNGESTWASLANALKDIGHGAVAEHISEFAFTIIIIDIFLETIIIGCKWIKRKSERKKPGYMHSGLKLLLLIFVLLLLSYCLL